MSNQFVSTISALAKIIVALQKNETIFFGSANKDYQGQYENTMYTPNTTVQVLLPFYPELQATISVKPTPIVDRTRSVTCDQIFSTVAQVNTVDLSLGVKPFVEKRLMQFYKVIQNGVERYLVDKLIASSTFIPVTAVSALKTTAPLDWLYNAKTMMTHMKMNDVGTIMVLNNQTANKVRKQLSQSAQSSDRVAQSVIRRGLVGQISGVPVHESADLLDHRAGQLAKVSGLNLRIKSIQKSADGLEIIGLTFNAYKDTSASTPINDISHNAVKKYDGFVLNTIGWKQPISNRDTDYVAFCRSNADIDSISGGSFAITLSQPLELAQLSREPAVGDAVMALDDHTHNFLYTRYGLTAVNPPLQPLKSVDSKVVSTEGISCTVNMQGDMYAYTEGYRISTMMGATVFNQNVIALPIPTASLSPQASGFDLAGVMAEGIAKRLENKTVLSEKAKPTAKADVKPKAKKAKPKATATEPSDTLEGSATTAEA